MGRIIAMRRNGDAKQCRSPTTVGGRRSNGTSRGANRLRSSERWTSGGRSREYQHLTPPAQASMGAGDGDYQAHFGGTMSVVSARHSTRVRRRQCGAGGDGGQSRWMNRSSWRVAIWTLRSTSSPPQDSRRATRSTRMHLGRPAAGRGEFSSARNRATEFAGANGGSRRGRRILRQRFSPRSRALPPDNNLTRKAAHALIR